MEVVHFDIFDTLNELAIHYNDNDLNRKIQTFNLKQFENFIESDSNFNSILEKEEEMNGVKYRRFYWDNLIHSEYDSILTACKSFFKFKYIEP